MVNIALGIEKMKHLDKLGLDTSDASMYWQWIKPDHEFHLHALTDTTYRKLFGYEDDEMEIVPAYTLQDIVEKIHSVHEYNFLVSDQFCVLCDWTDDKSVLHETTGTDSLEAAYNMLLWCIENNYTI